MDFMSASPDAADLASASSCGIRSVDFRCVVVIGIILACVQVRSKKSKAPAPQGHSGSKGRTSEGGRYIRIGKNFGGI